MLFHGPPGVGKTMLAERVPGLLPDLDVPDALEVSAVHSLAGFNLADELISRPPYSDPHHSASVASIVGGGQRVARPGAISCAHKGVLFLDEAPEFQPAVIEALPHTTGIRHDHARPQRGACPFPGTFPAHLGCQSLSVRTGRDARRSVPVHTHGGAPVRGEDLWPDTRPHRHQPGVPASAKAYLKTTLQRTESSAAVAERVLEARERQRRRLAGSGWQTNGEVSGTYLRRHLPLPDGLQSVDEAVDRGRLSARGVDKVLRLAWTIADLAGRDVPGRDELAIALAMRRGEQPGAARREAVGP